VRFSVTILGSGSAVPTPNRFPTSHYVSCNNRHILIDCGEGTQFQLRKNNIKIQAIQIILISHLHGDHFFGLAGLISTMHLLGRDKGLTIIGPTGLESIIRSQLEIGHSKLNFEINFLELSKNANEIVFEDKLITIKTFPLNHRIQTQGYLIQENPVELNLRKELVEKYAIPLTVIHRLKIGQDVLDDNGKYWKYKDFTLPPKDLLSYAFCSDTKYDERIVDYVQGVSLLYHEATFIEADKERAKLTFHSTSKEAATIALKAGVKKLIMGHISARYQNENLHVSEAKMIFENSFFANDGLLIDLEK
jgi:ribonuclease Z